MPFNQNSTWEDAIKLHSWSQSMWEVELLTHSVMQIGITILVLGRFQFHFRTAILKLNLVNHGWGISYEIAFRWMPLDLTDNKSTLVQVMIWCRQATSHYLSQCWPRSLLPYGITLPQWVKSTTCDKTESIKEEADWCGGKKLTRLSLPITGRSKALTFI